MFDTLPSNPNAFEAAQPLWVTDVTDPRTALRGIALGGCTKKFSVLESGIS